MSTILGNSPVQICGNRTVRLSIAARIQKCVTKLLHGAPGAHDMLVERGSSREIGGAALSSSLDYGREYAEQTQRRGEGRRFGCRAVLILIEVLILLMPLTEHLCGWDRFPRGGPDMEFGVLCLLLFAGLVLLKAHRAATLQFLALLADRLIALPLRCLFTFAVAWRPFWRAAQLGEIGPPGFAPFAGIPLRI